jgi:hypothetical protein
VQQSAAEPQAWPVAEQVVVAALQVPAVAPAGTSQVSPPQQSVVTVHVAPAAPQTASQVCVVALHESEQQLPFEAQLAPFGEHVAQVPPMHAAGPEQQVDGAALQLAPLRRHAVVAAQW